MIDLYQLMELGNSSSNFDDFFDESDDEKKSIHRDEFLNIEIPFVSSEVE